MLVWPQWWSFVDVSQQGVEFSKKISKMKIFFWFLGSHGPSKIRHHFRKKVVEFWSYQKMFFTKNVALNWYSSMKICFRKIWTFFDIGKWLSKSDLSTFWRPVWTSVKVKSKKYFYFTDFLTKMKPLLTHVQKNPPLRSH